MRLKKSFSVFRRIWSCYLLLGVPDILFLLNFSEFRFIYAFDCIILSDLVVSSFYTDLRVISSSCINEFKSRVSINRERMCAFCKCSLIFIIRMVVINHNITSDVLFLHSLLYCDQANKIILRVSYLCHAYLPRFRI